MNDYRRQDKNLTFYLIFLRDLLRWEAIRQFAGKTNPAFFLPIWRFIAPKRALSQRIIAAKNSQPYFCAV